MPPRVLKNKMYMQVYNYTLIHEPGASNPIDYMSRHRLQIEPNMKIEESTRETELFNNAVVHAHVPDALTIAEIECATKVNPEMIELKLTITQGYIHDRQKHASIISTNYLFLIMLFFVEVELSYKRNYKIKQ